MHGRSGEVPLESHINQTLQLDLALSKDFCFFLHYHVPLPAVGMKTVEGQCAFGDYNRIGSRALILFNKCLVLEVQNVQRYGSFFEMLQAQSLAKVLPAIKTIDEGVQVCRKFYTKEKEMPNGVLAICVTKLAA